MNSPSNPAPESPLDGQRIAPATLSATRPLYWSVRRELWENRSILIAPLAAAAVVMLGFLVSLIGLPSDMRALAAVDAAQQSAILAKPYAHVAMLMMLTALIVGVFYALDALHSERRDRSILFWKSLPVSDLITVLSKASIPLAVLPLLTFGITVILQLIMRLLGTEVLVVKGMSASALWSRLPLFQMELVLLYGLIVVALWHAPIYCWLLLVSGWARRATFLWAVLPALAIGVFEKIAFHTSYFGSLVKDRLFGFAAAAFDFNAAGAPVDPHFIPLAALAPGKFLSSPGLWLGLALAVACLAAAVRLRRYQGPI
jgi:ABC-2 type transport system permease protein